MVRRRHGVDEGTPLGRVEEDVVQDGHEGDTVDGAGALSAAIGADKLGTLAVTGDDHILDDLAHKVLLERLDGGTTTVCVAQDGVDQRGPCGGGGVAAHVGEPAAEIAEAGGLDDSRLADLICKLGDGGLDGGGQR